MKAIMLTIRLWYFYLTYKGIKKAEIRKKFAKNFKGKIFECVSKTNWKKDLMKIPAEEREFFKQFVGKVGLCFECDNVEHIEYETCSRDISGWWKDNGKMFNHKDACLTYTEMFDYIGSGEGYAIHITKLEIFDKSKEISEFIPYCELCGSTSCCNCKHAQRDSELKFICCDKIKSLTRAPQSWQYIEV
ncbi:MAG: hypothetical protein J6S85_16430 [Methanobrevibacter sp.]|nr:hypothetical protein [Methanobrevibacter sp.]